MAGGSGRSFRARSSSRASGPFWPAACAGVDGTVASSRLTARLTRRAEVALDMSTGLRAAELPRCRGGEVSITTRRRRRSHSGNAFDRSQMLPLTVRIGRTRRPLPMPISQVLLSGSTWNRGESNCATGMEDRPAPAGAIDPHAPQGVEAAGRARQEVERTAVWRPPGLVGPGVIGGDPRPYCELLLSDGAIPSSSGPSPRGSRPRRQSGARRGNSGPARTASERRRAARGAARPPVRRTLRRAGPVRHSLGQLRREDTASSGRTSVGIRMTRSHGVSSRSWPSAPRHASA